MEIALEFRSWFAPEERSAAQVRRFVRDALDSRAEATVVDDVVLAASELATNAVIHAATPFEVTVVLEEHTIRLEVRDESTSVPSLHVQPGVRANGRGLNVVVGLSRAWDAVPTPGGKVIWAEFDRVPRPAPLAHQGARSRCC